MANKRAITAVRRPHLCQPQLVAGDLHLRNQVINFPRARAGPRTKPRQSIEIAVVFANCVAETCNTRFLRLVEQEIPRLALPVRIAALPATTGNANLTITRIA